VFAFHSHGPLADKATVVIATFGRYCVGGVAATITHILVLMLLVERLSVNPSVATSIGFCIAVVVNYNFQYHWTFGAMGSHARVFSRYLMITFAMLGLNLVLFWFLTHPIRVPYLYAQMIATGVIMFCNFTINSLYTFNQRPGRELQAMDKTS
jgi:putative flippase GtrA